MILERFWEDFKFFFFVSAAPLGITFIALADIYLCLWCALPFCYRKLTKVFFYQFRALSEVTLKFHIDNVH